MAIKIIRDSITRESLKEIASKQFGDLVKAVIDINRGVMAIGGELHADMEALLLENESRQENLWGINLYPNNSTDGWVEFDSMINIKPSQNNRSRGVDDVNIQKKIIEIVSKLTA